MYRSNLKDLKSENVGMKPDFVIKQHTHYYRPFFDDFLKAMFQHPRIKFACYTSITKRNAMPLLINVFNRPKLKEYKKSIFNVYDQEYNKPDKDAKEEWKKMRDLNLVWADDRAKKLGFGPKNTLLIDSEYAKVRDFLANALLIKPFELDDLKNQTTDNAKVFKQLEEYIYKLVDEAEDVQEFLKEIPYEEFQK